MIATIALSVTLIASDGDVGRVHSLDSESACRLVEQDGFANGPLYAIRGTYFADGMHGSEFEIPACDRVIFPRIEGPAYSRIVQFHRTFDAKCGGWLRGDYISGVFIGRFARMNAQLFGMSSPMEVNFFVISDIETRDLDDSSIKCPK